MAAMAAMAALASGRPKSFEFGAHPVTGGRKLRPTCWATMRVESTWAISNRTTIPSFDAEHRHPRQPVAELVDPRLGASRAVLAEVPVSAERLKVHLSSHAGGTDGWTVCMHAESGGEIVEATTASMVVELADDPVVHWVQAQPCTAPHRTARFSEMEALLGGR